MKICKIALIGAGNIAREHLKAFSDIENVELVGIFSRTAQKAHQLAKEYNIKYVADSVADLYHSSQPDIVVVTVNASAVANIAIECCNYPWLIFCEKPVGLSYAEAKQVQKKAESANAIIYVALNRRFYHSTQVMLDGLKNETHSRFIEICDQEQPHILTKTGSLSAIEIKNLMYANSIHLIDYFTFLGRGEVRAVNNIFRWRESIPLVVAASIEYSSGDIGLYHAVWNAPGPWAVSVSTPNIRWEMRPLELAQYQTIGSRTLQKIDPGQIDNHFKPGFRMQAQEIVNAAMGLESKAVTLKEANLSMRLIAKIYEIE